MGLKVDSVQQVVNALDDGENARVISEVQSSRVAHHEPPGAGLLALKGFYESSKVVPVAQQHLHGHVVGLEHVIGAVDHCAALGSIQCQFLKSDSRYRGRKWASCGSHSAVCWHWHGSSFF